VNSRLARLKPYPFARLRTLLAGASPPATTIPLHIGEPKHDPPEFVVAALLQAIPDHLGSYPQVLGLPALREAAAGWLQRRYGLTHVDPETMVIPVNGTREALFSFAQAVIDPDTDPTVVLPNPCYQIYEGAALLAGAEPVYLGLTPASGYCGDLDSIAPTVWNRCQLLYLCSPNNPTGVVLDESYLARVMELADRYDFVVAGDECYAELYLDEDQPPPGLLQVCRNLGRDNYERCVVFHSLSKRSNLPGLRSGFVAGDPELLKHYLAYRSYHGCAVPNATQVASAAAWADEAHVVTNRAAYREKFAAVVPRLAQVLPVQQPPATFYLWLAVGADEAFTRDLYRATGVSVLPGSYLSRPTPHGDPGAGRVRISLVAPLDQCRAAAEQIAEFVTATGWRETRGNP
jgi:N-succinyldiaminopimelate aminotransferase